MVRRSHSVSKRCSLTRSCVSVCEREGEGGNHGSAPTSILIADSRFRDVKPQRSARRLSSVSSTPRAVPAPAEDSVPGDGLSGGE